VRDPVALQHFPAIQPLDYATAVRLALEKLDARGVETAWSDALTSSQGDRTPVTLISSEGMIIERRQRAVATPADAVYRSFAQLGGARGWLYMDWAWSLRGWMDKAIGGVGLRRGRRHPDEIRTGESLDFWRVEIVEKNRLMRLRAEMKVPGKAWLEFQSQPQEDKTLLTVTAYFDPHGLPGFLYWYAMFPFHKFIFKGLTRGLVSRARMLSHPSS